jgi:hypothetical protein
MKAQAIAIRNNRNSIRLDGFNNISEPIQQCWFSRPHIPRPTMDGKARNAGFDNLFDQVDRRVLSWQKADLAGDGHGEICYESTENL